MPPVHLVRIRRRLTFGRRQGGEGSTTMTVAICVAGATGWTGRAVAEGVLGADDLTLVTAVSRSATGQDLGRAWGGDANEVTVFGSVDDALEGVDVLIDYTSHEAVLDNTLTAIRNGVAVVVGSSGLGA